MSTTVTQNATAAHQTLVLRTEGSSSSSSSSARTSPIARPVFATKEDERQYLKERLAAAYRIFAKLGFDEGVAGHITVRDPVDPHSFWLNPYGLSFDVLCVSDLLRVDHDGNILEGGRPENPHGQIYNAAGFAIHGAIHSFRPDINAAAHSHSIYGKTFSTLGRNIDIASADGAAFNETVRLYSDFGGVVLDDEEGRKICEALGPHGKGVILQNHGILSAASGLEAAVAFFVRLESLCETQLLADAAGVSVPLPEEDAQDIFNKLGGEDEAWYAAQEMFIAIEKEFGHEYKL